MHCDGCFHPLFLGTISDAKVLHSTAGPLLDLTEPGQRLAGEVTCIHHEGCGREGPQENVFLGLLMFLCQMVVRPGTTSGIVSGE